MFACLRDIADCAASNILEKKLTFDLSKPHARADWLVLRDACQHSGKPFASVERNETKRMNKSPLETSKANAKCHL